MPNNGRNEWSVNSRGEIVLDVIGAELPAGVIIGGEKKHAVLTTRGEPTTMRTLRSEYGDIIGRASRVFDIPDAWIAGMIVIEARRIPGSLSFDPISLRDEDGRDFAKWPERPNRVSAGLMQTLVSTARQMAEKHSLHPEWAGVKTDVMLGHLTIPEISIFLGTAYMRDRADRYGLDPILLVAAYNAGGVYKHAGNVWNLRTYGETRIPKFAAYANDWLRILS